MRDWLSVWLKPLLVIVIGTVVVTVVVGEALLWLERDADKDGYPGQWTIRTYED